MKGQEKFKSGVLVAGWLMLLGIISLPAQAQQISLDSYKVNVNIQVLPMAQLELLDPSLLYMEVPPAGSTVNTIKSVRFSVRGNALATVTATPEDDFIYIPSEECYMPKALLPPSNEEIGYKIQVTFPSSGAGQRSAYLTGTANEKSTQPPLTVNLTQTTTRQREGRIDLLASSEWTTDGRLPSSGVYVANVVITVTASNS